MITFFIFLSILGVLIIVHEFGHYMIAKKIGVKVEHFCLGFGRKIVSRKKKGTEYSIGVIPLGGYVKLAGDNLQEYTGKNFEYLAQPPGKRFWVIFFGPLLNYVLGLLCFWLVFFAGYPMLTTKVGGLIDGFGAKEAGIQPGDRIIAIDGRRVASWEELQRNIQAKKTAARVEIIFVRDKQEYKVGVNIKEKNIDDLLGQKRNVGLLGVTPGDEIITLRHGLFESFVLGLEKTWELTRVTYRALWLMLTAKLSIREATGPLGIFFITSKVAQQGLTALLNLVGLISISLAIFNLLPLPVLDGGHILLLAIEKIRGRYLSLKAERIITQAGFTFIITLALVVTYNDIVRFFGDKVHKFFR